MRFIDEAKIRISAGHGGPGAVSFWREKFVPKGGPDGGDGGKGGDILFVASSQLSTLQDFRFKRVYQAPNGAHGSGGNKAGRDGESITIRVPVGTLIKDAITGDALIDFTEDQQTWIACKGGRGGKGNAHFATSTFQAPRFAQDGEEGTNRELLLELKLLADAAIIGFPNAGESTFISRVSAAHPKIADYPFTTLTPNLGVVSFSDQKGFVLADIPGLIEGAHRGLGLGHKFLKHIERTSVFIHLLDGAQILEEATRPGENSLETLDERDKRVGSTLIQRYTAIRTELGLFNQELLKKPEIVVINKSDLFTSDPKLMDSLRTTLRLSIAAIRGRKPTSKEPYLISSVSGEGISEILSTIQSVIHADRESRASNQKSGQESDQPQLSPQLPDDERLRH